MHNNYIEVLQAAMNVLYAFRPPSEEMEELAEELSSIVRAKHYTETKQLSLGDFVTCEPTRFGCPFGEITQTSQFGNQYGPDWVKVTWFKWNYVKPLERDDTNTIVEVAHQLTHKIGYELGLQRRTAHYILYEYDHLLPWRLEMEKQKNPLDSTKLNAGIALLYWMYNENEFAMDEQENKEVDYAIQLLESLLRKVE